jgi:hypothetical protein
MQESIETLTASENDDNEDDENDPDMMPVDNYG